MIEPPLRAAMAACGGIAELTLDAARRSPHFDVVALQDVDEEALERVGTRFDIERQHLAFEDLLTDDVDLVIVNGPNHVHLPQVRLAASAGKHCLVQKPMAPTLAAAREMVDIAAEYDIRLGVTMFELGKPLHHQVKHMVRSGWFGTPTLVQAVSAHDIYLRTPPEPGNWRRDAKKVGGGAFIQLAVHAIDLASWILDEGVVSVSATGSSGQTVFEDETMLATIRFEGQALGHFAASYAADLYGFTLCGTRGRVHLLPRHVIVKGDDSFCGEIFEYDAPGCEIVIALDSLEGAIERQRDDVEIHDAFARWILGLGEYPCPGERGVEDMKVVDAAYRSLEEGRCISIE